MPQRIDDRATLHDVVVEVLATQVEEAVLKPYVLGIIVLAEHRHGELGGRSQDLHSGDEQLDLASRQVRVHRALGARPHLAVEANDPFGAQLLDLPEDRRIGIGHALGDAVMVAQVDEQEAAMVADAMAPAGQPHVPADIGRAQFAAGMGAITVHGC